MPYNSPHCTQQIIECLVYNNYLLHQITQIIILRLFFVKWIPRIGLTDNYPKVNKLEKMITTPMFLLFNKLIRKLSVQKLTGDIILT